MEISIVIVNWNGRKVLLECLDSLEQNKSRRSMEVIVVDNGSVDGSAEAVRKHYPSVTVIENRENLGFAKGNNIGIKKAAGRYLCLINSDVWVREGCIDRMCDFMDENPSIGMLGPKILNPDNTLQDSCRRFPSLWTHLVLALGLHRMFKNSKYIYAEHMKYFKHDTIRDVDYIVGAFMMVPKEVVDTIGALDERFFIYHEEVDWCKRLWDGGWRVTFFPGAEAVHHEASSSSRDPVRFAMEQQKAAIQYWKKHHGLFSNIFLASIFILKHGLRLVPSYFIYVIKKHDKNGTFLPIATHKACLRAVFDTMLK